MTLEIHLVPLLRDNYGYLLRDLSTGTVGVVDPSEAEPIEAELKRLGWPLHFILSTHHHGDHTGGNLGLKQATGAKVVGAARDAARIPGIDIRLEDGERFSLGDSEAVVIDVPGHTRGHIAFHFEAAHALFCGDTLFALGCGRLLEGDPAEMWRSLDRLRRLPPETSVHCGHEYTAANAKFALTIEPGNERLVARAAEIDRLRAEGKPTVPSNLGEECRTNPFLRADEPAVALAVGLKGADATSVFAAVRAAKDRF